MLRKTFGLLLIEILSLIITGVLSETSITDQSTYQSPSCQSCNQSHCYWETDMNIEDTVAVWDMLIQPIVVVEGNQKEFEYLLDSPSEEANPVAEVTCASQGVHVLQTLENGWSLVECYSSSFFNSKIKAWNELSTGYIKTKKLSTRSVRTDYGLVVDKLSQRLYVFGDGDLLGTLLISTGLPNDKQPYNETRSGEYIIVSPVGAFSSGNLTCDYGMRFNNGDLIHEVPYLTNSDGTKNYSNCEDKLGERASHGCIRVQRLRTPDGINMKRIWNTLKSEMGTKVVIWEDYKGRQILKPDPDLKLFHNPKNGKYYHSQEHCYGVKDEHLPLTPILYTELNTKYKTLIPCNYCNPVLREEEINSINSEYIDSNESSVTIKIF